MGSEKITGEALWCFAFFLIKNHFFVQSHFFLLFFLQRGQVENP